MVSLGRMLPLRTTITVHAVRIYHEFKLHPCLLESIHKQKGVLEMDIVISGAVCKL